MQAVYDSWGPRSTFSLAPMNTTPSPQTEPATGKSATATAAPPRRRNPLGLLRRRNRGGYDLTQILIWIAVVAILAGVTFGAYVLVIRKSEDAKMQERLIGAADVIEAMYTATRQTDTVGWGGLPGTPSTAMDFGLLGTDFKVPSSAGASVHELAITQAECALVKALDAEEEVVDWRALTYVDNSAMPGTTGVLQLAPAHTACDSAGPNNILGAGTDITLATIDTVMGKNTVWVDVGPNRATPPAASANNKELGGFGGDLEASGTAGDVSRAHVVAVGGRAPGSGNTYCILMVMTRDTRTTKPTTGRYFMSRSAPASGETLEIDDDTDSTSTTPEWAHCQPKELVATSNAYTTGGFPEPT